MSFEVRYARSIILFYFPGVFAPDSEQVIDERYLNALDWTLLL